MGLTESIESGTVVFISSAVIGMAWERLVVDPGGSMYGTTIFASPAKKKYKAIAATVKTCILVLNCLAKRTLWCWAIELKYTFRINENKVER